MRSRTNASVGLASPDAIGGLMSRQEDESRKIIGAFVIVFALFIAATLVLT
jgi:hypothetical protein